jgi:HlyD family secretion protein
MSATAEITTKTENNVIAVPLQAIVEKKPEGSPTPGSSPNAAQESFDKPKAQKGVFVLDNGRAKFVAVETGITGDSDIQILSGLSEGQEVITGPSKILNTLKEDAQVRKQEKPQGGSPGSSGS